jgi:hypothetical protein
LKKPSSGDVAVMGDLNPRGCRDGNHELDVGVRSGCGGYTVLNTHIEKQRLGTTHENESDNH